MAVAAIDEGAAPEQGKPPPAPMRAYTQNHDPPLETTGVGASDRVSESGNGARD